MLICPVCRTAGSLENVSPGLYRCTAQILADVIPPGTGPNYGPIARPIYRRCNTTFEERAGLAAAADLAEAQLAAERKRQADKAAAKAAYAKILDLENRKSASLTALKAAGNPGLQPRRVPGRWARSSFGRSRKEVLVNVQPAWPIGRFTWRCTQYDQERFEKLDTGYTPGGSLVPMKYATGHDTLSNTGYDRIEAFFSHWEIWPDTISDGFEQRQWLPEIVAALEAQLKAISR